MSWRSARKGPKYDYRKFGSLSDNKPYRTIRSLSKSEVEPIISLLGTDKIDETIKQCLRKYLVVSVVSALEHFFKNQARLVIDKNDMKTSAIFDGKISFTVDDLDQLVRDQKLTKGRIAASTFNFMDLDDMDAVFSNLLQMKFLHYVKILNNKDQTKQLFDGHPIPLDYRKLREGYYMRHQIIHELKDVHLTKTIVHDLWEHALNLAEISNSVIESAGDPQMRAHLDQDYETGIEQERKKKIFRGYYESILKKLLLGEIQLPQTYNLTMADLGIGESTEEIDGPIRVMRKRGLVEMVDKVLRLTDKGRRAAKRTKK